MTSSKQMEDVMRTVTEIISQVKCSPKRENLLGKLSYFSKPSQRKPLIILSSTRLHYRVKEKGQTMDLSIITFKLKDITIVQTHIIPQLRNNTSGKNILKISILSYHQLTIVSINLLSRRSSIIMKIS